MLSQTPDKKILDVTTLVTSADQKTDHGLSVRASRTVRGETRKKTSGVLPSFVGTVVTDIRCERLGAEFDIETEKENDGE